MRPLRFLPSRSPRSTLSTPSSLRLQADPPSLCHAPDSAWQRLLFWLLAPAPLDAAPPLARLPGVRAEFIACLADVAGPEAETLARRVDLARSLRELWHLRAEVYRVVAIARDQATAERRLVKLNRHFPARAPRSAFAPL
jgi:hypothetical protein